MKIKIFKGHWKRKDVLNSKEIFVFGDNNARVGKGGQAIIRGLNNTFGIRTKKGPNNKAISFYTDKELSSNIKKIDEDILGLKKLALEGNVIVFSDGGYGTGLSKLPNVAPKTFEHLCNSLKYHFKFDNTRGIKYNKIPGHDEIVNGKYLNLLNSNKDIIQPINNSYFLNKFLNEKIYSVEKLITTERKTAFTSKVKYQSGKILKIKTFGSNRYVIIRIIDNYNLTDISKEQWSFFEGYDSTLLDKIKTDEYYQVHFDYICTLSQDGTINFKDDLFKSNISDLKKNTKNEKVKNLTETKTEKELRKEIEELKKKVNQVSQKKTIFDKIKSILNLKELSDDEVIRKNNIGGVIKKINVLNSKKISTYYEITEGNIKHYVEIKKILLLKDLNLILSIKIN